MSYHRPVYCAGCGGEIIGLTSNHEEPYRPRWHKACEPKPELTQEEKEQMQHDIYWG